MEDQADSALAAYREAGGDATRSDVRDLVAGLGNHAPALLPLVVRDPSLAIAALTRPLDRSDDGHAYRRDLLRRVRGWTDGPELRRELRRFRHLAVLRIAGREFMRLADIDQTSAEMADLASAEVEVALQACLRTVRQDLGVPTEAPSVPLVVLGMGKLGGRELNLGSDIDLCFFYEADEGNAFPPELSVHEVYTRVASRTSQALSEVTEDGFVFRVDLRLRPEGSRGPLVNSLASAERYYETFGRTWERAALLRARPIAGDRDFGERLLHTLKPFVFRRTVDPSLAHAMADLVHRARRQVAVDSERDIKLGRGGIREAEFTVQTLQLIWGGQHPELQVLGTVDAIGRLVNHGFLTDREGTDLAADWALLRRVEHRLHLTAGYQTHSLPSDEGALDHLARSLGFDPPATFGEALDACRDRVHRLFASLVQEPWEGSSALDDLCDLVASGASASEVGERAVAVLPLRHPDEAGAHLVRLGRHASSPLGPKSRQRLPTLGPLLLHEIAQVSYPDEALRYLADFFGRLGGHWGYDRWLAGDPRIARRLIRLFGAGGALSSNLVAHPEWLYGLLSGAGSVSDSEHPALNNPEAFVRTLREQRNFRLIEIGLAYVNGDYDLDQTAAALTELAERQVESALGQATREITASWRAWEEPSAGGLAVVGMGKLGAREMGFGSDLDLLFLYGADGSTPPEPGGEPTTYRELFTRIAQRTMRILSQPDAAGPGWVLDTRLRPSGSSGMLVCSLAALDRYHADQAESWERQAWIRARFIAGDATLVEAIHHRRARIAFAGPAPAPETIAAMRARIEAELAQEGPERLHPKLGYGALLDVEFAVQWLQMKHGHDPRVYGRSVWEAVHSLREARYLSKEFATIFQDGWRFFRSVEQTLNLMSERLDAPVVVGGLTWERVARQLGFRDRDGQRCTLVLSQTWQRRAQEVRATFDRVVAPVGRRHPWRSHE